MSADSVAQDQIRAFVDRPTRAQLAQSVSEFAAKITPAEARWDYVLQACSYPERPNELAFVGKAARAAGRLVGHDERGVLSRLSAMRKFGSVAAARAWFKERPFWADADPFAVPALEPWHLGHVYFARLDKFPHVMKVGFTRRLHERLEDIESRSKTCIGGVKAHVGTMADEAQWHRRLQATCIQGEWFVDPSMPALGLPSFLMKEAA